MSFIEVPADNTERAVDPVLYPLLSTIKSPADLRTLPPDRLTEVCRDIRAFLIDALSSNPGHFASSMGAVELTVALHYVFDTPYDRIVWDVGHQAYGHKLLTGRATRFHTNRKLGGLSGFPTPAESEYDTFSAGHASNSISAALGMAVAATLHNDEPRRNVVAVIGDASISGGLAFEGINNAANTPNNLLIILNDNDMSIDRNVGSLNGYLAHLTTSRRYNRLRYNMFNALKRFHLVSDKNRGRILRFNNSLKSLITHEQNLFEGLNIRYFGPFDGHDLPTLIRVLNDIKDMEGPRILHLRTIKGRGYTPAEQNPAAWHAPGQFNPSTGERKSEQSTVPPKYQDVFGHTITALAAKNPRITGITAAMPSGTSLSVMKQSFPERTFDVGISEGHAVTFAAGLAKDGMLPYVAIYSSFLQRAYDQIIHDVALQELPVTFCIDRAGIVGEDGATHHGAFDLAYLSSIPGMTICAPRNEEYLRRLLYTSQLPSRRGPMAIRYPRGRGMELVDYNTDIAPVTMGQGESLCQGRDVAILTIGPVATEALKAAESLKESGIDAAVYDMIFLKPLDESIMHEVAESRMPVITVEDGSIKGGLGAAVAEWMNSHGYTPHITRLGLPDKFVPQGTVKELHRLCGIDAAAIKEACIRIVKK
ncbi:MAG: 1-deoxy-D-xylulose-5-phosphate synthase [Muribaculaceae bacterium]|nr:1-deoxy-D-xylulose-5-phosphate synthase [Muribaculaceae bacterium]